MPLGKFFGKKSSSKPVKAEKKTLKEPIAVKDSLNDSGAKRLKEAAKDGDVCPFCQYEDPTIRKGVYQCCGNKQ